MSAPSLSVRSFLLPCLAIALALHAASILHAQIDPHVRVDQFGYRPNARKVAVLRSAVQGFDAPQPFVPGALTEVRRTSDQAVVWSGAPVAWRAGLVHSNSGDRCWLVDFSALRTPGEYELVDVASGRTSVPFRIAADVYEGALRAALRVYFYQRCGFAKQAPFAEADWVDGASHLGAEQDLDCRSVLTPASAASSRDLSGGWYDAGDYNKYINFADDAVHPLLDAYLDAPAFWLDGQLNIPESGNGLPDLLDEVKWEIDWMLRMQNADGSLLHKVSVTDFSGASPPSADTAPRRYAPATASATASGAAVFSHAAVVYGSRPEASMQAYAATLDQAAADAWNWLAQNPGQIPSSYSNQGFQNVAAEDTPYQQDMNRLQAAAWLFIRSGDPAMRAYVDQNYQQMHLFQWSWASPWESELHAAMLAYTEASGSTSATNAALRQEFAGSVAGPDHLETFTMQDDPYGAALEAQNYTWGSNATKALWGGQFLMAARFGVAVDDARDLHDAAEGYLHYLHGNNPLGLTYLTNVRSLGAEGSVDEMYHGWFADGTIYDNASTSLRGPAPGYLTGGPNPSYAPDPAYTGPVLTPPQNQPAMKSYLDWNTSWPQNSWEVTEPAIGYQSRYVKLLAAFAVQPPPRLTLSVGELVAAGAPTTVQLGGSDGGGLVVLAGATTRGRITADLGFWSLDLGLDVLPAPSAAVLAVVLADAAGRASVTLPGLPSATIGIELLLQASEVVGIEPSQSAVIARTIR